MSNDDNYYVPGYFEQMLLSMNNVDLVMCQLLHSKAGWAVNPPGNDLAGGSLGRRLFDRSDGRVPEHTSDQDFLREMLTIVGKRVAVVSRPLFIHN